MAIVTYRQALHDTLREEMQRDPNVVLMGEEIGVFEGSYKITAGLLQEFGEARVRDTPIAEEGFVGAAIGAAMLGMRPVVEIMTINFIMLAIDQIVNHAAKIHYMFGGQSKVPLVIRTPGGGGQQLAATHSQNPEVWFAHVPGLKVVAPSTPADARGLLKAAIRDDDPVLFLENLALYNTKGEVPDDGEDDVIPIGVADVKRRGTDVTIVSYSRMAAVAMTVAEQLATEHGIDAEVVDLRSLRPLDRDTIVESVKKTNRAVVFEEDWRSYGVGAEIAATIQEHAFDYLDAPVRRIAAAEVALPYAKIMELSALPTAQNLIDAVRATVAASGGARRGGANGASGHAVGTNGTGGANGVVAGGAAAGGARG
jgi:pyruvate dehydrogenase E1 component beta subunit